MGSILAHTSQGPETPSWQSMIISPSTVDREVWMATLRVGEAVSRVTGQVKEEPAGLHVPIASAPPVDLCCPEQWI